MAGNRNWFNEFFAKDTSRKVRAVNKAKERLTTNIPYGYKANPDNPKEWAVDEDAAKIVKRIFILCMGGKRTEPNRRTARKGKGAEPYRL